MAASSVTPMCAPARAVMGLVEEATASPLHAGDAKPRHRLKAVFQAQTIHQWHWPGVIAPFAAATATAPGTHS